MNVLDVLYLSALIGIGATAVGLLAILLFFAYDYYDRANWDYAPTDTLRGRLKLTALAVYYETRWRRLPLVAAYVFGFVFAGSVIGLVFFAGLVSLL